MADKNLQSLIDTLKAQNNQEKIVIEEIKNLRKDFSSYTKNFTDFSTKSMKINNDLIKTVDNMGLMMIEESGKSGFGDDSTSLQESAIYLSLMGETQEKMLSEMKDQTILLQLIGEGQENLLTNLKMQNINDDENISETKKTNSILDSIIDFFRFKDTEEKIAKEESQKTSTFKEKLDKGIPIGDALPSKGILGKLFNFGMSAIFGSASGTIKSLIPAAINSKLLLKGMRGITGLLLGPELINAFSKGMAEGDVATGVSTAIRSFLLDDKSFGESLLAGAGAGFMFGGVKGAIAGALLAGTLKSIEAAIGTEGTKELTDAITGFLFSGSGALMAGGLFALNKIKTVPGGKAAKSKFLKFKKFGIRGLIAGLILTPVIDAIENSVEANKKELEKGVDGEKEPVGLTAQVSDALFGKMYNGESFVGAAAEGALFGSMFGLPGAIIGGVMGVAYNALDSSFRKNQNRSFGDATLDALGKFYTKLDLGIAAFFGDEKAQEMLDTISTKEETANLLNNFVQGMGEEVQEDYNKFVGERGLAYSEADKAKGITYEQKRSENIMQYMYEKAPELNLINKSESGNFSINTDEMAKFLRTDIAADNSAMGMSKRAKAVEPNMRRYALALEKSVEGFKVPENYEVYNEASRTNYLINPMRDSAVELIADSLRLQKEAPTFLQNPTVIPTKTNAFGGVYTKPELVLVGESPRNNPEIIFNRQQLQALGTIFNMQKENNIMKSTPMMPMMPPMPQPNIVDNKKITVQEQFNITEVLPAPSSHISFKDNILR